MIQQKNKLRGTKIFINNDLTPKEREIQRIMREIAREERKNGAEVKIGYQKIRINKKDFIWKEENLKEAKFRNRQTTTMANSI